MHTDEHMNTGTHDMHMGAEPQVEQVHHTDHEMEDTHTGMDAETQDHIEMPGEEQVDMDMDSTMDHVMDTETQAHTDMPEEEEELVNMDMASNMNHGIDAESQRPMDMPEEEELVDMDMASTMNHGHRRLAMEEHSDHDDHGEPQSMTEEPESIAWALTRPHSLVMAPIYDSFDTHTRSLAGVLHGVLAWEFYLTDLLPPGSHDIVAILKNSCGQMATFEIQGPHAEFIGDGDLHDAAFDDMVQTVDFGSFFKGNGDGQIDNGEQCFYSLALYPSKEFQDAYASDNTTKFLILLSLVFAFLGIVFFVFVWFVQRRQQHMMGIATRTTAIVSQLFPEEVRERILAQAAAQAQRDLKGNKDGEEMDQTFANQFALTDKHRSNFGGSSSAMDASFSKSTGQKLNGVAILEDAPIADQYPETTVFFGDLVGKCASVP